MGATQAGDVESSSVPPALLVIPPGLLAEPSPPALTAQPCCQTQGQGTEVSSARA